MTAPISFPALSVRQPWAWAIIHGGKDIENRIKSAINKGRMTVGPIAIHASKHMSRDEYESARDFMASIGVTCPPAIDLMRGGIIGTVRVTDIVKQSASPWWIGPHGLVLSDPEPCDFIPVVGALGYFKWKRADASILPPHARWMLQDSATRALPLSAAPSQRALFE